jgi:hypothetical protein
MKGLSTLFTFSDSSKVESANPPLPATHGLIGPALIYTYTMNPNASRADSNKILMQQVSVPKRHSKHVSFTSEKEAHLAPRKKFRTIGGVQELHFR